MSEPGLTRGLVGFVVGFIGAIVVLAIIRIALGQMGALGANPDILPASGALLLFGGFGGLFGWLWGVGSFNSHSTEHNGIQHVREEKKPGAGAKLRETIRKVTPGIIAFIRPLVRPLVGALGICLVVLVIIMAGSWILNAVGSPVVMVTTDTPTASAVTPLGSLNINGLIINKTVFFIILAAIVLGIMAGMAIVLALVVNGLSEQVEVAKKMPAGAEPPDSPVVRFTNWAFSLIEFFLKWVDDILVGIEKSVER